MKVLTVGTCPIGDCTRPIHANGVCSAHNMRIKKGSKNLLAPIRDVSTWGQPCLAGCGRTGRKRGLCETHYRRWSRTGEIGDGPIRRLGRGDDVSYEAVHYRLLAERGSPRDYRCVDCDKQAHEWSHEHGSEGERRCPKGRPYTTTLSAYAPRCRSCHRRLDWRKHKK